MNTIQIKRGLEADLSNAGVIAGELKWTKDTNRLWIGTGTENIELTGDAILYVDTLPTTNIDETLFYYLNEDTTGNEKGLYFYEKDHWRLLTHEFCVLYNVQNSISYDGQMIPQLTSDDIEKIANHIDNGDVVTIKDRYNALYLVIRGDKINDEEYQVEYQYYDGKSVVWTYMLDSGNVEYRVIEPLLKDGEYNELDTENKTIIGAINELKAIESYVFKGYVSTTEPTGILAEGELWYEDDEMPTEFPVECKEYKEGAWSTTTSQYSPKSLDLWANIDDDHGYYWFGNKWNLIDVNVEYDDETIDKNLTGQLEIKDQGIKFPKLNDELVETNVTEEDDEQIVTEGAVWREKIKEATFEIEKGEPTEEEPDKRTDILKLSVTNNKDEKIIDDKEVEIKVEDVTIWDYDAETDETTSRVYELHMEEKEKEDEKFITFSSPEPFDLKFNMGTAIPNLQMEASIDKQNWVNCVNTDPISAVASSKDYNIYVRGMSPNGYIGKPSSSNKFIINGSGVSVSGNINTLLNYQDVDSVIYASHTFSGIFLNCTSLITVSLELPATTLASYCYRYMFYGCTSLTQAPELPATTLANFCYDYMFYGCTSLTQAPELPATTLADYCYRYMFRGCTSLTQAPELPATTLAGTCYSNMFYDCTSLTQAPELPATTLANACYHYMFYGCTSLTQAPELPATTLANACYYYMFYNSKCRLYTSPQADYTRPWSIPEISGTLPSEWKSSMFGSTGGDVTEPQPSVTYYTNDL